MNHNGQACFICGQPIYGQGIIDDAPGFGCTSYCLGCYTKKHVVEFKRQYKDLVMSYYLSVAEEINKTCECSLIHCNWKNDYTCEIEFTLCETKVLWEHTLDTEIDVKATAYILERAYCLSQDN